MGGGRRRRARLKARVPKGARAFRRARLSGARALRPARLQARGPSGTRTRRRARAFRHASAGARARAPEGARHDGSARPPQHNARATNPMHAPPKVKHSLPLVVLLPVLLILLSTYFLVQLPGYLLTSTSTYPSTGSQRCSRCQSTIEHPPNAYIVGHDVTPARCPRIPRNITTHPTILPRNACSELQGLFHMQCAALQLFTLCHF